LTLAGRAFNAIYVDFELIFKEITRFSLIELIRGFQVILINFSTSIRVEEKKWGLLPEEN